MGLFDSKETKQIDALADLTNSVMQCALSVVRDIAETQSEKRKAIPDDQDYDIRKEILCFYLHILDRIAKQEGGNKYYTWLQDKTVQTCSELLVELSFDNKNAKAGFDAQVLETKMVNDCIDLYNQRGEEYRQLQLISVTALITDNSAVGKFMFYLTRIVGRDNIGHIDWSVTVPLRVMQYAEDYKFIDQVRGLKKFLD